MSITIKRLEKIIKKQRSLPIDEEIIRMLKNSSKAYTAKEIGSELGVRWNLTSLLSTLLSAGELNKLKVRVDGKLQSFFYIKKGK